MAYFKHRFDNVEGYLHHRAPYLLVQRIASLSESEVIAESAITGDEFFIQGHFPGAPILPGAIMQEMTTQTAGVLIAAEFNPMEAYNTQDPHFNEYALGVLVKIRQSRFRGFARPGDQLQIKVNLVEQVGSLFDFKGEVSVAGKPILRNSFQLTNIKSSVLTQAKSV